MTSLRVICGLGPPPNQKSWLRLRIGVHVWPEGPGPLNWNSIICLMSIFRSYFFKSILCVKTGEVEVNRY